MGFPASTGELIIDSQLPPRGRDRNEPGSGVGATGTPKSLGEMLAVPARNSSAPPKQGESPGLSMSGASGVPSEAESVVTRKFSWQSGEESEWDSESGAE